MLVATWLKDRRLYTKDECLNSHEFSKLKKSYGTKNCHYKRDSCLHEKILPFSICLCTCIYFKVSTYTNPLKILLSVTYLRVTFLFTKRVSWFWWILPSYREKWYFSFHFSEWSTLIWNPLSSSVMFCWIDMDTVLLVSFFPYFSSPITKIWRVFFATLYPQMLETCLPVTQMVLNK